LHGTTFEYDEKGVVRREMVYSVGQLNGKARVFDSLGVVTKKWIF
jgi:antitoxin component YwqK of YwqJK toxin-antitoxin module